MSFLKSVPIVCVIVLLLMWVGSVRVSAIAVFLAVFPAIYFSVLEGRAAASPGLGELLRVMGVPGWRRFLANTWQQLLPYLVATCRNACGMAWKAGVAAELIGSPRGSMGERIYQAKLLLETGDLFAWTIVVVALSWACEKAFLALLRATRHPGLRRRARCHLQPCACARVAHGALGPLWHGKDYAGPYRLRPSRSARRTRGGAGLG